MRSKLVMEATEVKTHFGTIPAQAAAEDITVTKRGAPVAYIVSPERYRILTRNLVVDQSQLVRLSEEYDRVVAGMQTPAQTAAVDRLMAASDEELQRILDAHHAANPVPAMAPDQPAPRPLRLIGAKLPSGTAAAKKRTIKTAIKAKAKAFVKKSATKKK